MSGMTFSRKDPYKLFITDNTDAPVCISIRVPEEDIEKPEVSIDDEVVAE